MDDSEFIERLGYMAEEELQAAMDRLLARLPEERRELGAILVVLGPNTIMAASTGISVDSVRSALRFLADRTANEEPLRVTETEEH